MTFKPVKFAAGSIYVPQIGPCDEPRIFTLSDANALMPLLRSITRRSHQSLQTARNELEPITTVTTQSLQIEATCQSIVQQWVNKMERLGVIVKGLWLLELDTGDGYLCWKYPEASILYYHEYGEPFSQRRYLQDVIREMAPDWANSDRHHDRQLPD